MLIGVNLPRMKKILLCCFAYVCFVGSIYAEDRLILLKDGSQIQGKIVSFQNGIYVVRSSSMGELKLADHQVQSISNLAAMKSASNAPLRETNQSGTLDSAKRSIVGGSIQQIQAQIASDPSVMSSIMQLQSDPEMQALLSDPEVMRAIQTFDIDALSNNPRILKLMQSRKFKEIESRISP